MSGSDVWREWLERADCLQALKRTARMVYREALQHSLPGDLLPCGNPWKLSEQDRLDCFQALAHELWLFLRNRPKSWMERNDLKKMLTDGKPHDLEMNISQSYLQHLKDLARTSKHDPWRALYRRLRQLLGSEESICYRATPTRAFYSLDCNTPELPDGTNLQATPYSMWESPRSEVDAATPIRKDELLRVARFFWEQATTRLGKGYFLPVRELTHYLAAHYAGLLNTITRVPIGPGRGEEDIEEVDPVDPTAEHDIVYSVTRARLPELAKTLTAQWKEKQQKVFYLIQGEDLTLEKAAVKLGYSSAASVSYVRDGVREELRDFCQLWPGLSPPDLDDDLFSEFVMEVLEICKKQFCCRI